jgi:hypothetical protein
MLFGFSSSLLLLLRDFYAYRRNGGNFIRKQQGNHPGVFTLPRVMSLLFVLGYGAVACLSKIPPLAALPALLSSCCAVGLMLKAEPSREGHRRFRLVPIKKTALTLRVFCLYFRQHCPRTILPWAPAAVLVLFLPFILPGSSTGSGPELEATPVLSAEDYEAHVAFQRFFSLRPLEDASKFKEYPEYFQYSGYYRYSMDKDGLVIETGPEEGNIPQTALASIDFGDGEAFHFFPLADLMGFLKGYTPNENFVHIPEDLLSILLILIPTVPSMWAHRRERRKGNSLVINDKRIAA